jgi:hypothetical protein
MKLLTLAAVLLLATVSSSTWAQSSLDHEAHHPDKKEAPATTQPTPGQPGMGSSQGMMGGGGMMNMMGGKMPMMDMMQMMGMMRQPDAGMGGMATIDRVEGRIAFLRAELKITDAQASAWNAFADALRTNAKTLGEVRASMMPQAGMASQALVDRLALQEKWLAARLEGTRAIKSALASLVGTFSDEQKRTADEILAPHMGLGMMAMTGAQMPSGQMGSGKMQPGQIQTPGTGK